MAVTIRGESDEVIDAFVSVLNDYGKRHPHAKIECYRSNSASIRVRIIDPEFEGIDRVERHDDIWRWLEKLPEPVQFHLSRLILLTPEEAKMSFSSYEFDNPISLTL